jgi:hypothetical protein
MLLDYDILNAYGALDRLYDELLDRQSSPRPFDRSTDMAMVEWLSNEERRRDARCQAAQLEAPGYAMMNVDGTAWSR